MDIEKIALEVERETDDALPLQAGPTGEWLDHYTRRLVAKIQAEQEPDYELVIDFGGLVLLRGELKHPHGTKLFIFPPNTAEVEAKYYELIMAVGKKYPGETRHETALRYIKRAEENTQTMAAEKRGGK